MVLLESFLVLLGSFQVSKTLASIAVLGVILGAVYMLYMYKKVFYGKESKVVNSVSHDLNLTEVLVLIPFILLIFVMGIMPNRFLDFSKASIEHLVENKQTYSLKVYEPEPQDYLETYDLEVDNSNISEKEGE